MFQLVLAVKLLQLGLIFVVYELLSDDQASRGITDLSCFLDQTSLASDVPDFKSLVDWSRVLLSRLDSRSDIDLKLATCLRGCSDDCSRLRSGWLSASGQRTIYDRLGLWLDH